MKVQINVIYFENHFTGNNTRLLRPAASLNLHHQTTRLAISLPWQIFNLKSLLSFKKYSREITTVHVTAHLSTKAQNL